MRDGKRGPGHAVIDVPLTDKTRETPQRTAGRQAAVKNVVVALRPSHMDIPSGVGDDHWRTRKLIVRPRSIDFDGHRPLAASWL